MHRFKRIRVGLSLGEQDQAKIRFAALISRLASSEVIIFIHVISTDKVNEKKEVTASGLAYAGHDEIKSKMRELVRKYYDGSSDVRLEFQVFQESSLIEIELLRHFKDHDIGLNVIGKIRRELTPHGTVPTRLARKAPCSILFVPEGIKPDLTHILVPIDFSKNSEDALSVAVALAIAYKNSEIHCFHAYSVPTGYYKTGKSYEQFADIMKGHAEEHYHEFIEKFNFDGIRVTPVFQLADRYPEAIKQYAIEHHVDLLVIGARGRTAAAGVLLGSVTEKLISTTTMPLHAVKRKH